MAFAYNICGNLKLTLHISMSVRDTAEVYLHLKLLQAQFSNARCIENTITVEHAYRLYLLAIKLNERSSIQFIDQPIPPGCTIKSILKQLFDGK